MKTWSAYDPETGEFTGEQHSGPDFWRPDLPVIEGQHRHDVRRVDLKTGEVIAFRPESPSPDHEWDEQAEAWRLTAAAQAVITADSAARVAIGLTETGSLRAIREGLLELLPADSPARVKLQDADDAIAAERPNLKRARE